MTSIKDWALFCVAVLFLMIGVHQSMLYGFLASYWAYMISASCLMYYAYKKKNTSPSENSSSQIPEKKPKTKRK